VLREQRARIERKIDPTIIAIERTSLEHATEALCDLFAGDNPKFDRSRFNRAANRKEAA
jgi:hypothetical protein